jgi:hypothetical protein
MRLWVVLLGACGFHPTLGGDGGAPPEAIVDVEDADIDAGEPGCLTNWTAGPLHFMPRHKLTTISTVGHTDRDPALSKNLLQIWFQSDRGGGGSLGGADIWTATRTAPTDDFGTPVPYNDANSAQDDGRFFLTGDSLTYVVSSNRTGSQGGFDVWISHRATAGENFPVPSNQLFVPVVDTGADDYDPWIGDDGKVLYYAPAIGGVQGIFMATRTDFTSSFASTTSQTTLDIGNPTSDPFVFDSQLVIVFSSHALGNVDGGSKSDLWYSTRTATSAPWAAPTNLPDLNTIDSEGDPWVSANGCHLYFAATTGSDYDLYEADVIH